MKITKEQLDGLKGCLIEVFSSVDDIFTKHPEVRDAFDEEPLDKAIQYIGKLVEKVKESK